MIKQDKLAAVSIIVYEIQRQNLLYMILYYYI